MHQSNIYTSKPQPYTEEVSMKWMDRPSVTEMESGGVLEMDGQKKVPKMEMLLKWIICNNTFKYLSQKSYYRLSISLAFPFFWHFVCLSIS